jgi:hypothetical protein
MDDVLLDEKFAGEAMDRRLEWMNEPPRWGVDAARRVLWMEPAAGTDFWRKTHYGFEVDNGHVLACAAPRDRAWVLTTHVRFAPVHQYDQAGLMVRVSPTCWLKASVEYEPDGPSRLGAVVTNGGYSDWSTQDWPVNLREVWLRVRREIGGDYIVESTRDTAQWTQIRVAHLMEDADGAAIRAGLYACSPKGAGFRAEFAALRIEKTG